MLKLFQCRRSTFQPQPLNLLHRTFRFPIHSTPDIDQETYDPPFSRTSTHASKQKTKSKITKKNKNSPPKITDAADEFPIKSELPFDFMYSYSETSTVEPIGFREPTRFSPFGPGRIDRKWTGTSAPFEKRPDLEKWAEERERVLGEPLSEEEIEELVEKYRYSNCCRQINLGRTFCILSCEPRPLRTSVLAAVMA